MMRRAEPYLPDLGNNQTDIIILGQTAWILHPPSPQLHSLNASQPLLTSTPCSLYISMSFYNMDHEDICSGKMHGREGGNI